VIIVVIANQLDRKDGVPPQAAPGGRGVAGDDDSAAAVALDYLRRHRDRLVEYDPRVRRNEPDAVHKMRVATRRLRSVLKTFRPQFDRPAVDRVRSELRWLGELLGEVRDREVLGARLAGALATEPPELVVGPVAARISERLRVEAASGRTQLLRGLDSERYPRLLDDLDALLAGQPTARGQRPAAAEMPRRVRKAVRRVDRLVAAADRAAGKPTGDPLPLPGVLDRDTALHEARKAAKEARYAAEAARPVAGKRAKRLARAMEGVQELLGDHRDSVVARSVLRDQAMRCHAAGENSFSYGLLHAREAAAADRLEADFPNAWRKASRRKVRGWLG
jgi:CHAD domain-containing protein